jgi:hypothetical protein
MFADFETVVCVLTDYTVLDGVSGPTYRQGTCATVGDWLFLKSLRL